MVSTGRSHPSCRFRAAVDRINRFANDPDCGGSVEDISALVSGDAVNAVGAHDDPKDLVALLIKNNPKIWNDLLNNPFCVKMKTAKKGDQKMEEGFKRYMIQDFFYIANQMVFDTERVNKVKDAKQYNDAIDEVINHAEDAKGNLEFYNTDLKISSKDIFSVDKTKALMAYLKADKEVAENYRWNYIETLVFMIPCIKGWYDITKELKDTSGISTDTLWYNQFIKPNANPEWSIALAGMFAVSQVDWKSDINILDGLFIRACQCEIDLFKVGDY